MAYIVRVVLSYLFMCSAICGFGLCQVVLEYWVMGRVYVIVVYVLFACHVVMPDASKYFLEQQ